MDFINFWTFFAYRKHISSKSNVSVLTVYGKCRYIKIIVPFSSFCYQSPAPFYYKFPPPFYGMVSIFPKGHFIMTPLRFKIFFWNIHTPAYLPSPPYNYGQKSNCLHLSYFYSWCCNTFFVSLLIIILLFFYSNI